MAVPAADGGAWTRPSSSRILRMRRRGDEDMGIAVVGIGLAVTGACAVAACQTGALATAAALAAYATACLLVLTVVA